MAPLLALLWDLGPLPVRRGGAATPQAWTSAPQRRALLIEGWEGEEEESGGHWVGVTHDGTARCLSRGETPLAMPPDLYAAASAVLASIPRVYAAWNCWTNYSVWGCVVWFGLVWQAPGPWLCPSRWTQDLRHGARITQRIDVGSASPHSQPSVSPVANLVNCPP